MSLRPHANQSQSALEVKLESRKWVKSNYSVNFYAPTWARMFYSCTRALHPHACPTLARYPTFVRLSRSRRGILLQNAHPAPSHTRIPLPHAYSAPECVSRLCPRIAFLHACPFYAGVSHSRTRVLLLILDHISVPNWRAHINCLGAKGLKFKTFTFEYFNTLVKFSTVLIKETQLTLFICCICSPYWPETMIAVTFTLTLETRSNNWKRL